MLKTLRVFTCVVLTGFLTETQPVHCAVRNESEIRGLGGQTPASHRRGPGSIPGQPMCDLRRTESRCDRCLSPSNSLSPVSIIPPMFHTHFHLNTTLIKRTSVRSLGTSKYSNALLDIGVLSLFSCFKEFIKVSFSSEYFIVPPAIRER